MKKILTFAFLSFLLSSSMIAQNGYIPIRLGVQFAQAKDTYFSPLPYNGFTMLFGTGVESANTNAISRYTFNSAFGSMKAKMEEGKNLRGQDFGYIYSNYHYAPNLEGSFDQNEIFVGFSWKISMGTRNGRNTAMDIYTSLNFTASAARNSGGTDTPGNRMEAGVQIPLLAYVVRPQYAVPLYANRDSKFKSANVKLMTVNKLQALDFYFHFTDFLKSSNAYRVSYEWQYYRIKDLHTVNVLNQNLNAEILWAY